MLKGIGQVCVETVLFSGAVIRTERIKPCLCDFSRLVFIALHFFNGAQTYGIDVCVQRAIKQSIEQFRKIIFAVTEMLADGIQRDVFRVVFVDIMNDVQADVLVVGLYFFRLVSTDNHT